MNVVSRGDVWHANLNPSRGKETHGTRPCLVISVDSFNHGPADLVVVLPITTSNTGIPFHIRIDPPESKATKTAYIKTEQPRCISMNLERYRGNIHPSTMRKVEDCLRILLGL